MGQPQKQKENLKRPQGASVSLTYAFFILFTFTLLAFLAGQACRSVLLTRFQDNSTFTSSPYGSDTEEICSIWVQIAADEEEALLKEDEEDEDEDGQQSCHVMFNFEKIDSDKIDSKQEVAELLKDILDECDLDLSAYYCHESEASSIQVTCAGELVAGGHAVLHSMPQFSWVTLDIQVLNDDCELLRNKIEDVNDLIETEFHISGHSSSKNGSEISNHPMLPHNSHILMLREYQELDDPGTDLMKEYQVFSNHLTKVASVQSNFQKIDIIDKITPRLESFVRSALAKDPSYISEHPELFKPDRYIFLDGVIQSTRLGNAAYHESLVHPAMFAHENPKRVAIIGGGECATLKEALKHNTVEEVVMVEIDPVIIEVSKQHLPEWNDCSNLLGSTRSCMDDPRAKIYTEDAFKWFIDRYSKDPIDEPLFDVIIMDALDPQNVVEFASALYGDGGFLTALFNSLSEDGILISQVGESSRIDDPSDTYSMNRNRLTFVNAMVDLGFESILTYLEAHSGFYAAWSYFVAFKDLKTEASWKGNPAIFDIKIKERSVRTVDGTLPFQYFDGATMKSYQYASKADETTFCRLEQRPKSCDGAKLDPNIEHVPVSKLTVKKSTLGDNVGRGVFATQDIPANTYIALDSMVHQVQFDEYAYELIDRLHNIPLFDNYGIDDVASYMYGYGFTFSNTGKRRVIVDAGIITFANHGCNGTSNVGVDATINEESIDLENPVFFWVREEAYDPIWSRSKISETYMINHRSIKAGEEILDNYIGMITKEDNWAKYIGFLRSQCRGEELGEVAQYEKETLDELGQK